MAATSTTAISTAKTTVVSDAGTVTRQPGHAVIWLATGAPTVDNDSSLGVKVGDIWVNTSTKEARICVTNTAAGAVWSIVAAAIP